MTRAFTFRTQRWQRGLEVYIYEGEIEAGVTNTYDEYDIVSALNQAEDWIEVSYGLTDDEYVIAYETGAPRAQ